MNKKQKQRFFWVIAIILTGSIAASLTLYALNQNINVYYTPTQLLTQAVPLHHPLRVGGLVKKGSFQRHGDGLDVQFVLIDQKSGELTVQYRGVLPALFREGQGLIVQGLLLRPGLMQATEVLAKHDENYKPPAGISRS